MKIARTFLLISLLFLSCGSSKMQKNGTYRPFIDTYWVLYAIQQEAVSVTNDIPPYILFDSSGRYSGYTGCNHFFGNYKLTSNKLTLDYAGATRKLCLNTQELESSFLKMLKMEIRSFKIEKDTLLILGGKGELLHFVAADSIPTNFQ